MIDFDGLVLGPCVGTFGQPVIYMPGSGGAAVMSGVFDDAYVELKYEGGETPVATTKPMLGMQVSAFTGPLPCRGELFQIGGTIVGSTMTGGQFWSVTDTPRADSHGHLKVFLMLARNEPSP